VLNSGTGWFGWLKRLFGLTKQAVSGEEAPEELIATPASRTVPPVTEEIPTTSVFHKGELINDQVMGHRPLSMGANRAAVEALDRPGTIHEFRIPKDVLKRWELQGNIRRFRDFDAATGTYNEEIRFDSSLANELNGYRVR
jgi:hypothetical protein